MGRVWCQTNFVRNLTTNKFEPPSVVFPVPHPDRGLITENVVIVGEQQKSRICNVSSPMQCLTPDFKPSTTVILDVSGTSLVKTHFGKK